MEDRPTSTAQTARQDIDIEPAAGELQRAAPQTNPPPPRTQVVRELPRNTPQVEQSAIVRHSEDHIGEVFAALAAAQGEFGEIERTLSAKIKSERADYSYDYAPLDEVLQAVRPSLSKNGLSIMQFPFATSGAVTVRTLLGHSSGGWFYNDLRVTTDGNAPRETGSAITYARRYALMAMLGVAPAVDDDGGAAQPKGEPPRAGERRQAPPQQASRQAQPPAPPAAPAGSPAATGRSDRPKPAGRPARPAQAAPAPQQDAGPQDRAVTPNEPPVASQPVSAPAQEEGGAAPAPVGRIVELVEKPNGAIVVLETGFRGAAKDAETVKALKVYKNVNNATIKLTTHPSSDPSRYAPIIDKVEIVQREREPGEEG